MEEKRNEVEKVAALNSMSEEYNNVEFEKEVPFTLENADLADTAPVYVESSETPRKKSKKVDISKLTVVDSRDPIQKQRDLKQALYGNKSAFQIVAAQSGYVAKIAPLVHKDTVSMLYSNLSRYEYRKTLFKVIYEKIIEFSVGPMTFDEWLKNTSVEDIETFYYGIYCATFPDEGILSITCPKCEEEQRVKIANLNLAKTSDKAAMKKLISEVSSKAISKEIMHEFSLIGKNEAFELPVSKLIVDLRTPTLWDSLELLRVVPEAVIDKDIANLTNMLYINRILVPNKSKQYTEITDRQEILAAIDSLGIDDAEELKATVSDRVDENRITYSIKNYKCQKCGNEIKDIPISIEEILFTLIYDKIQ